MLSLKSQFKRAPGRGDLKTLRFGFEVLGATKSVEYHGQPVNLKVMATSLTSSSNDTYQRSIYKMAYNFYLLAAAAGFSGEPPEPSDTPDKLLQLTVDYTAILS